MSTWVRDRIRKAFSKAAPLYDEYAHIQRETGLRLIEGIKRENFSSILEVGCGSGNYTIMLRRAFPKAKILSFDLAFGMLRVASKKLDKQGIWFVLADGERPSVNNRVSFDLITSNCTFQWFEYLEVAIKEYRDLLNGKGVLHFSIFGPKTLWELKEVIRGLFPNIYFPTERFLNADRIKEILKFYFKEVRVEEVTTTRGYEDLRMLLKTIRYTGGNGLGFGKEMGLFFTPSRIRELEETYFKRFGMIKASYQIFFCGGRC